MEAHDRARASGGRATLARVGLAAAAAIVTVNIWTGAPLLALWIGSRTAGPSGVSMTAIFVVVAVLSVLVLGLLALLTRLNARYDRLTGREQERRVAPWMRSMRSERDEYAHERHGATAIERVVVVAVAAGVLSFNVWFFFFAGSPLGNG